ncbi:MAG: THUMP domain-containing protein [Bacteroidetes bacterium]|nr:THUMP domain-containing protein [Bacteroidota bacterium]
MTESPTTSLMVAKTISGLEPILKAELDDIGALNTEVMNRSVSFEGDKSCMYRANYLCRSALRILLPVHVFDINAQEDLYREIKEFPWEDHLDSDSTLAIDAVISYTVFTNSQFVAQKTKDAIVDRFREKTGKRPSVDLENPTLRVNVHLFKNTCTVSLDASGQSLHKRGYRKQTGIAPLNEVLAAGLILLSGWDRKKPLLDPMCGSGTILIEAAMLASAMPSGYFRNEYGFMKWKDFDETLWETVKSEALAVINHHETTRIVGFDKSVMSLKRAAENVGFAGLDRDIYLKRSAFEDSVPPSAEGIIIMNPPYDERIELEDSVGFYKMIGNVLKRKYSGYKAWVISSDLEAIKFIGLKPSRKIRIFNGPLECRFLGFDLYEGKKTSTFAD